MFYSNRHETVFYSQTTSLHCFQRLKIQKTKYWTVKIEFTKIVNLIIWKYACSWKKVWTAIEIFTDLYACLQWSFQEN